MGNQTATHRRALIFVHIAVALFGLAGLFGKLVATEAHVIVLGRTFFAAVALAPLAWWLNRRRIRQTQIAGLLGLGFLLAVHWLTFFLAIQVSTVAIGLLTFASFPLFTLLLELAFLGRSWRWGDVWLTAAVGLGLVLVVPEFTWQSSMVQGAAWGVLSGLTYAILTLANRQLVRTHSVLSVALWQYVGASLCLMPFATLSLISLPPGELLLLVVLGVLFTAFAHAMFVSGLRHVSAHTASVLSTMEPVYGIAVAWILLDETPLPRVLLGGAFILAAAVAASLKPAQTH